MTDLFAFIFAVSSMAAAGCFLWGLGSAGMNGIQYSSLGPCLAATLGFVVAAAIAASLAGIH
jgi:hypothetical protein